MVIDHYMYCKLALMQVWFRNKNISEKLVGAPWTLKGWRCYIDHWFITYISMIHLFSTKNHYYTFDVGHTVELSMSMYDKRSTIVVASLYHQITFKYILFLSLGNWSLSLGSILSQKVRSIKVCFGLDKWLGIGS